MELPNLTAAISEPIFPENGIFLKRIEQVVARENIEVFVEQLFGRVDVSDRSFRGLMKLARFGKEPKTYRRLEGR